MAVFIPRLIRPIQHEYYDQEPSCNGPENPEALLSRCKTVWHRQHRGYSSERQEDCRNNGKHSQALVLFDRKPSSLDCHPGGDYINALIDTSNTMPD